MKRKNNFSPNSRKKLKFSNKLCDIIAYNSSIKLWLVEWEDMTRTWEKYEKLKDNAIFQRWIEGNLLTKRLQPFYIS